MSNIFFYNRSEEKQAGRTYPKSSITGQRRKRLGRICLTSSSTQVPARLLFYSENAKRNLAQGLYYPIMEKICSPYFLLQVGKLFSKIGRLFRLRRQY
jgi:hypothetical protein